MKKTFYTQHNKFIPITTVYLLGFVVALSLAIYSVINSKAIETIFFTIIILVSFAALIDANKKGFYNQVILTEDSIVLRRFSYKTLLDIKWSNVVNMNITNNGLEQIVKINCVEDNSKETYFFKMLPNKQATQLLKSYFKEYGAKRK